MKLLDLLRSGFAREAVWTVVFRVTALGSAFLVTVLLARALEPAGYGIYSYALALIGLLSLPAQSGLPILLMRETARNSVLDRADLVRGVWTWTRRVAATISLVLLIGGFVVVLVTSGNDMDSRSWTLLLAFALVPLMALGNLQGAALRGLERVLAGIFPEYVMRPVGLLALLAGLMVVWDELTPAAAMAANVTAVAVSVGVGAVLLWRNTPDTIRQASPEYEARAWISSALPLALIAGMMTINGYADILMLGLFESAESVGVYRVAVQLAVLVSFGMEAVNMVVAPRFARLYAERDMTQLQSLATGSARLVFVASMILVVLFVVFGRQILDLVFGSEYLAAYVPLLILMAGGLVNSATGSTGYLLNMTGHEKDEAKVVTVAAVVNIVLNLLLIPLWGAVGAATATAISYGVWRLWLWTYVRRRLGINSSAFAKLVPADASRTNP